MMKLVICLAFVCLAQGFPQKSSSLDTRDSRIVGGEPAQPNEFPYQVALMYKGEQSCGGSILNEYHVITAAHCLSDKRVTRYSIVAGEHSLTKVDGTEQTIAVAEVFNHENYNNGDGSYANDIAIVRLATPLEFNNAVQPIALPKAGHISTGIAKVTGWGTLYENGPTPDVLHKLSVPIISDQVCEGLYGRTSWSRVNGDIMICAGYLEGGKDSCQRDSGGPLAASDDGVYLAGVVSWGNGCALSGYPGVYAEVVKYLDWIAAIIQ